MIANLLSIAGSDPSGGAGVQADLKTFAALGCYGMAVITALTAQNTRGVRAVHGAPPDFLAAQIDAIFEDIRVDAVKIGMLGSAGAAAVVADRLAARPPRFVVLDPVLAATGGDSLGGEDVARAIVERLLPLVDILTPNTIEAARLSGCDEAADLDGLRRQGAAILAMGARAVLLKGGHIPGAQACDLLMRRGSEAIFAAPRIETRNTHGTGCTLSSAITAYSARGRALPDAVEAAKAFVTGALRGADALSVGAGHGPLHHFWALWPPE